MPELPEVETVRTGLARAVVGKTIVRVELRRADLRFPFPPNFAEKLSGGRIQAISRRAKYLLFEVSGNQILLSHLGMTGRFSTHARAPKTYEKHDHVVLHFEGGSVLVYNDARRFGMMDVCDATALPVHPWLAHLGPEPLEKNFSAAYLKRALLARKTAVKLAIMDQEMVVGVGNIYASEALFKAGIHPRTPAADAASRAGALNKAIREVLHAALASGGSSLRDFVDVQGETGYFQHQFAVYGRDKKPCFTCASEIQLLRQGGRSTFYCPNCQR